MAAIAVDPALQEQIEQVLADYFARRGGSVFTTDHEDKLDTLYGQVQNLMNDASIGRAMDGPLWLSGTSVLNGTITADKLTVSSLEAVTAVTGSLNVTGNIIAAAIYPATSGERVLINSTGIATINASDVETARLDVDGSGFIGIGTSKISWTAGGAVTVPAAAISALTIADIGSGTFNSNFDAGTGRVRAGTALQRVELVAAGLIAYDAGGTETFRVSSSDGSLSMTGVFSMKNAAIGSRVEMANVGLRAYNSGGTQTFGISSSDGSGFLGTGGVLTWSSAGTVVVNGSVLATGSVTANKLLVSTLSAISADMGTITAGTISAGTVNASVITTGTLNGALLGASTVSNSAIDSMSASKIDTGTLSAATITLGTGGSITDGDGSTWDSTGFTLIGTSVVGDQLKSNTSGGTRIWTIEGYNSGGVSRGYFRAGSSGAFLSVSTNTSEGAALTAANGTYQFYAYNSGTGMGSSTNFAAVGASAFEVQIGSTQYLVVQSGGVRFANHTVGGSAASWSTFSTANIPDKSAGYVVWYINGVACRFPFYANS